MVLMTSGAMINFRDNLNAEQLVGEYVAEFSLQRDRVDAAADIDQAIGKIFDKNAYDENDFIQNWIIERTIKASH